MASTQDDIPCNNLSLEQDLASVLLCKVQEALEQQVPLAIRGCGTKDFYGRSTTGEPISVACHRGIISYEPTELVLTARAGTSLEVIEKTLAEHNQMLTFEPPYFGPNATLGGTIACGLSGPRRPFSGAARDFVLGVRCISGRAELLNLGGQVMKNVAGYDVARLMCGSLGTLGILVDISLKVLPRPERERTLVFETDLSTAIQRMNQLAGQPWPLSASCYLDGCLYLRLSGAKAGVEAARHALGGETLDPATEFWRDLREHRLPFFSGARPLWRLSLRPAAPPLNLPGEWLLDWGGAQRWLRTDAPAQTIWETAAKAGGHATRFRGGDPTDRVFQPLPAPLQAIHQRLKREFDPQSILNPGRMYPEF